MITRVIVYFFIIISNIIARDFIPPKGWDELHNDNNWEVVKENNQIRVCKKVISVTTFLAFRIEYTTDVSPFKLIQTIWDIDDAYKVFGNSFITHSGIYETHDSNYQSVYQIIDVPFLTPRLYQFDFFQNNNQINWVKINHSHPDLKDEFIIPKLNAEYEATILFGPGEQLVTSINNDIDNNSGCI